MSAIRTWNNDGFEIPVETDDEGYLGVLNGLPGGYPRPEWLEDGIKVERVTARPRFRQDDGVEQWSPSFKVGVVGEVLSVDDRDHTALVRIPSGSDYWVPWVDLAWGMGGSEVERLNAEIESLKAECNRLVTVGAHRHNAVAVAVRAINEVLNHEAEVRDFCEEWDAIIEEANAKVLRDVRAYYDRNSTEGRLQVIPALEGRPKERDWALSGTATVTVDFDNEVTLVFEMAVIGTGTGITEEGAKADADPDLTAWDVLEHLGLPRASRVKVEIDCEWEDAEVVE